VIANGAQAINALQSSLAAAVVSLNQSDLNNTDNDNDQHESPGSGPSQEFHFIDRSDK
jgi:hypothetical protein